MNTRTITVQTGFTKRAWIRDPQAIPGYPAPGKISCPCGQTPQNFYADGQPVYCPCGITYDSTGNVIETEVPTVTTQAITNNWTPKTRREYQRTQRAPSTAQTELFDAQCNLFE